MVAEGMSLVWRRSEINYINEALNTRLSFAVSAGPSINYRAKAGTKNKSDMFVAPVQKMGRKTGSHVSNLRFS